MKTNNLLKMLKVSITLVLAVAMLVGCGKTAVKEDPKEVVTNSFVNTGFMTEGWLSGEYLVKNMETVGSTDMQLALIESIFKGASIKYDMKYSLKEAKTEMKLKLMLDDTEIIEGTIHFNGEYVALEVPQLYDNMIYMNWKDIPTFMTNMGMPMDESSANAEDILKHIAEYKDVLDIESYDSFKAVKEGKLIPTIIESYYTDIKKDKSDSITINGIDGKEVKIEGDLYTANVDFSNSMKKTQDMYKQIFEDENVKKLVLDILNRFLDKVIENKDLVVYNSMFNEGEDVQEWTENETKVVNATKETAKTEIEKAFKEVLEDMEKEMISNEEMKVVDKIYDAVKSDIKMIVKDEKMQAIELNVNVDLKKDDLGVEEFEDVNFDEFKLDMLATQNYHIGEKVEFAGLTENAVNVSELNQQDLLGIYMVVMQNVNKLSTEFQTGNMGQ